MDIRKDKYEASQKYRLHFFRRKNVPRLSASELEAESDLIYKNLMQEQGIPKQLPYRLWYSAAAAAVVLIIAGAFWQYRSAQQKTPARATASAVTGYGTDILPGRTAATLRLASGKKLDLGGLYAGQIAEEPDAVISKTPDGAIIYVSRTGKTAARAMNTLATVKGEQYQVILPDGTKVWLNSASSITYPTSFSGVSKRMVKLAGEAYFEVAKDRSKPFIVKTLTQEVEVLGTHFNVNSYSDETVTRTTLLEGSVKVTNKKGQRLLKPGQQAVVNGSIPLVSNVNPSESVAWKNGDFVFDNESFDSIMRQLARWYNVEIVGNAVGRELRFSGTISRSKPISTVLKALELTGQVKFKLEGRTVIIE